ncbi:MAG: TonB-dependent receptor, partial [Opitutaceae bacterium]
GEIEVGTFPRNNQNWQVAGGTEAKFFNGAGFLSVKGNYSHSNLNVPAWTRLYANVTGIGFEIDRRDRDAWYPNFTQTAGPSLNDAGNYRLRNYTRVSYRAPNDLYSFRADYKHTLPTRLPVYLKAGVKYDRDQRSQEQENEQASFVGRDGLLATADDTMAPFAVVAYRQAAGRYGPWPFPAPPSSGQTGDPLQVPAGYWRPTASNAYAMYVASRLNDVKIQETIRSAYLMGNTTLGKLRVLAGLRMEETSPEATAWLRNATASFGASSVGGTSFDPAVVANNVARAEKSFIGRHTERSRYRNFFPGAHFVYEPQLGFLIRASYNRSITRPPAGNLIPQVTENPDSNPPGVTLGNPGLRPYTSDNVELGVEKYFEPVGVIGVSVFQKQISNYFRSFVSDLDAGGIDGSGTYANYRLTQTRNIGSARIRGVELRYDQQFSFLPGFLRGFGFNSNFTYLETEGDFGTAIVSKNLVNFRPRSGAAGLSYRGHGLQANLLAKWEGRYFGPYQDTGTLRIYQEPRTLFDLKLQYRFRRNYDLYLDTYNLFDTSPRSDVSEDGRIKFFRTKMGVGFSGGIKARF